MRTRFRASAASGSPLGDMLRYMGDHWFSNFGIALATIVAVTVVLALVGSILSAMNTGVRITYVMGRDKEMPGILGLLHGKYATPHGGIWVLTTVSAILGVIGAKGAFTLTFITLAILVKGKAKGSPPISATKVRNTESVSGSSS